MDVGGWLRSLGLGQYEALFRASEIDADILPELTEIDLEKLGVPLGHRKRLLRAISALTAGGSPLPNPPLSGLVPGITGEGGAGAVTEAERRQLTVMFCDLVGSTALSVRFDPEELREEIRAYQNTVSGVVARYDGFVAKFMGDGVLTYFGYPRAHEDDAERAVRAGLEIEAAVRGLETRGTERLAVRIGVATGLVVVGDLVGEGSAQEQAVVGETPKLAARLQALALPGQIVIAGAHDHFQKAIELYDRARHAGFANRFGPDSRAAAEIFDVLTLWVLGRIDEALRLVDRALADAKSAAHAPTMVYALGYAELLGVFQCKPEAVATYGQAFSDIVSRDDLPAPWPGLAVFFQGWATWSDGAEESSLGEMRRGLAINREQGFPLLLPPQEVALAEAEASAGETDAGLRRLDDALAELEATEARWYEAEMHRIRAGILLKHDPADTAAAEQSLQAAIAIAQLQKARSFELRAVLSLAKLYRAADRDADAHAVLAPVAEGFPPTQQFHELPEAQALLSALVQ